MPRDDKKTARCHRNTRLWKHDWYHDCDSSDDEKYDTRKKDVYRTPGQYGQGHSHDEDQGWNELESEPACDHNDDQAHDEPDEQQLQEDPIAALIARLQHGFTDGHHPSNEQQLHEDPVAALIARLERGFTDGHHPSISEEQCSLTDDEVPSEAEELYSYPCGPVSHVTEQVHPGHGDTSNERLTFKQQESTESPAEDKAQLAKTIRDGIGRCKQAMDNSRARCDGRKKEECQLHEVELQALDETRERIKTQELILSKRSEIHVRLPTNQVVTPAHNALVEEDAKEGILITESFKAVKDEKANIRARLAVRLDEAEKAYESECAALGKQIEGLYGIARLANIELDGEELDLCTHESAAPVIRIQQATPARLISSARKPASNHARSKHSNNAIPDKRQKPKRTYGSTINTLKENCYNCNLLEGRLAAAHKAIHYLQAGAPVPELGKFIQDGERILSKLEKQRDNLDKSPAKANKNELHMLEIALQDLTNQEPRIKDITDGIGHLWEHEHQEIWDKTFKMCREESRRIKKEKVALVNRIDRCKEKGAKRQGDSEKLFVKQVKFYGAILGLARSEVENRWVGLVGQEESSDDESESESDSGSDSDSDSDSE